MLPSPAELEYFLEVTNALNFSRASERLGISQPSLSLAIKRLEQTIGTDVFIRHKQGVTLTQAGKQLLLHVRQLLQFWETTRSQALASQQEIQGNFTLGCHSTIAIHMVSKFLPSLLDKHPKLEIHLKHNISRKIMEQVINLSIDIGMVVNPIKHPDLIIRKLQTDEITFWSASEPHPSQDIHSGQAILICDPAMTQVNTLLKKIKKMNLSFGRIVTSDNLEVMANLIANGCGIGILPTCVAESQTPQLKKIPNAPVFHDELCLIYRNENRNVKAVQVIINTIKDYFC